MAYKFTNFERINLIYATKFNSNIWIFAEIISDKLYLQSKNMSTGTLNKVVKTKIKFDNQNSPYVIYFKNKYYLREFIKTTVLPQFKNIGIFNLEDKYKRSNINNIK